MLIKRGHDVNRLEAFSDGVFAFSATLLVVSLEVPRTFPELVTELRGYVAFGVSFAVLILIWSVHNAFFRRYGLHDRTTIALNAALLFVVLFYVYPMKFLVGGLVGSIFGIPSVAVGITTLNELSILFMLYGGGFVAVFGCVALLYLHAYRRREELELNTLQRHEAMVYFRHYLIFVGVGMLSILLAWTGLGVGFGVPGFIYGLLGPACAIHGMLSRRSELARAAA